MIMSIPHLHLFQIPRLTLLPYGCQLVAQIFTCTGLCSLQVSHRLGLFEESIQLRVRGQHVVILKNCFRGDQEAPSVVGIQLVEMEFRGNDQIFSQNLLGVAANVNSCLNASAKQPFAQSRDCYGYILEPKWKIWPGGFAQVRFFQRFPVVAKHISKRKLGFSSIYNLFSACRCNVFLALNMYICSSCQWLCLRKDWRHLTSFYPAHCPSQSSIHQGVLEACAWKSGSGSQWLQFQWGNPHLCNGEPNLTFPLFLPAVLRWCQKLSLRALRGEPQSRRLPLVEPSEMLLRFTGSKPGWHPCITCSITFVGNGGSKGKPARFPGHFQAAVKALICFIWPFMLHCPPSKVSCFVVLQEC